MIVSRLPTFVVVLTFLCSAGALGADSDVASGPYGLWLTEKEDVAIRIEQCGDELCGFIKWLRDDVEQVTPDGEPLCNQEVLWDLKSHPPDDDLWKEGKVYEADEGKVHSARIRVIGPEKIELRAYKVLPFIGKTFTLTRVGASEYPACAP